MVSQKKLLIFPPVILAACVCLYFIAVLIGAAITVKPDPDVSGSSRDLQEVSVCLDDNGRHLDLWLPAEYCGFLPEAEPAGWYGFGWGDRDFFLGTPEASDLQLPILLKALFLPSRPVLAVQYSEKPPYLRYSVTELKVSAGTALRAGAIIRSWFVSDGAGGFTAVPESLVHPSYEGYRFFESRGSYSALFTSNNWVNMVLKKAGAGGKLWTPLTFGITAD